MAKHCNFGSRGGADVVAPRLRTLWPRRIAQLSFRYTGDCGLIGQSLFDLVVTIGKSLLEALTACMIAAFTTNGRKIGLDDSALKPATKRSAVRSLPRLILCRAACRRSCEDQLVYVASAASVSLGSCKQRSARSISDIVTSRRTSL